GIESRAPFLDYRLVNFALGLPANMKTKIDKKGKVYLKYLLRETFKDILPREIYSRKDKIGFSSNANDLLRNDFSFLVSNSKSILEKYLPEIDLIKNQDDSFQPYARWEYQVVQIAITYLLYCRKYSPKDVELILSKGALI
ncbi:MAG: asparagine synthase-related protein, partial [Actinobacteria bacterium]|nr:asparagine synthase-related protein [Actinomycetota bacterium]